MEREMIDQLISECEKLISEIRKVDTVGLKLVDLARAADEVEDFIVNNLGID